MPSEYDGAADRPPHVKLVRGCSWYWDPLDRLRKSHKLRTVALGSDQAAAWAYARPLHRDKRGLGPDAPIAGRTERWTAERAEVFRAKAIQAGAWSVALAVLIACWFGHRRATCWC